MTTFHAPLALDLRTLSPNQAVAVWYTVLQRSATEMALPMPVLEHNDRHV
jgi:hypothetical protein